MAEQKTKHTPGPWVRWVGHLSIHAGVGEMKHGSLKGRGPNMPMPQIADPGRDEDELDGGEEEALANATLISAAPELLDACRLLVATLEQLAPWPPEVAEGVVAILGMGKDAITKATVPTEEYLGQARDDELEAELAAEEAQEG